MLWFCSGLYLSYALSKQADELLFAGDAGFAVDVDGVGFHGAGSHVELLGDEGQAAALHEVAAHFGLAGREAQGLGEAVES